MKILSFANHIPQKLIAKVFPYITLNSRDGDNHLSFQWSNTEGVRDNI